MLAEAARHSGRLIMEMPYFWSRKSITVPSTIISGQNWPAWSRPAMA
jgi:KDO2-lipid IV(A) lauroyltransferase